MRKFYQGVYLKTIQFMPENVIKVYCCYLVCYNLLLLFL